MTQFTVVVDVAEGENPEERAQYEAERVLNDILENYYINSFENANRLDTDEGQAELERAYEQTKNARVNYLSEIQEIIEEKGVEGAATDEDVQLSALRLSAPELGKNRLIDATAVRPGEPIHSEHHLEKIQEESNQKQYVVVFEVERV